MDRPLGAGRSDLKKNSQVKHHPPHGLKEIGTSAGRIAENVASPVRCLLQLEGVIAMIVNLPSTDVGREGGP